LGILDGGIWKDEELIGAAELELDVVEEVPDILRNV